MYATGLFSSQYRRNYSPKRFRASRGRDFLTQLRLPALYKFAGYWKHWCGPFPRIYRLSDFTIIHRPHPDSSRDCSRARMTSSQLCIVVWWWKVIYLQVTTLSASLVRRRTNLWLPVAVSNLATPAQRFPEESKRMYILGSLSYSKYLYRLSLANRRQNVSC